MSNDPFEFLSSAGNHPTTWILMYGPMGLGAFLLLLAAVWIVARRRRQQRDLDTTYKEMSKLPSDERTSVEIPKAEHFEPALPTRGQATPTDVDVVGREDDKSWFVRLRTGLSRTREYFESGLKAVFVGKVQIGDSVLESIHEVLYRADVGVRTADRLIDGLRKELSGQEADWDGVRGALSRQAKKIFLETQRPLNIPTGGPWVILVVGVNGVGKTTTIGKLAARYKASGKSVMLCAADTFRAAAIDQLQVWGERNDVPVIKQHAGADPAAVAFDGVQAAKARGVDVLIIDTAGRLHSKTELMAELSKINKSIGKDLAGAPHETWIVLDATTGQNAVQQCKAFSEVTPISGIVMTKLDGTAKGGVIIGIADQFKIPIRFIGVGETAADLRDFSGDDFVETLF